MFVKLSSIKVSTHSRLKAAGDDDVIPSCFDVSSNTQPPEGGWFISGAAEPADAKFQHTAA